MILKFYGPHCSEFYFIFEEKRTKQNASFTMVPLKPNLIKNVKDNIVFRTQKPVFVCISTLLHISKKYARYSFIFTSILNSKGKDVFINYFY